MTMPMYEHVADRLRGQITSGLIEPGEYLPPESELQIIYGVSRGTARDAVRELVDEGLVVSLHGRGHQVRQPTPMLVWRASNPERGGRGPEPTDSWSRDVREQGHIPAEFISAGIARADVTVARWLQLPPRTLVAVRHRLRSVDGAPFTTADSWFPRDLVEGTEIMEPDDIQPGVFKVFERIGHRWVRTVDTITARAPARDESAQLRIPRGVAVAEVARVSHDEAGRPVRLTLFVLPGDRFTIEYTHPKGR